MSIPIAESGQPDLKGHTKGKGSRESAQAEQTESTSQSDYLEQVSVQQDSHGMLQFMSTTRRRRTFPALLESISTPEPAYSRAGSDQPDARGHSKVKGTQEQVRVAPRGRTICFREPSYDDRLSGSTPLQLTTARTRPWYRSQSVPAGTGGTEVNTIKCHDSGDTWRQSVIDQCQKCLCFTRTYQHIGCTARLCVGCCFMLFGSEEPCPLCGQTLDLPPSLMIECENWYNGCKWTGEEWELEAHPQSCDFALLPCANKCKSNNQVTNILRRNFQDHITNECPRRRYQCPHCKEIGEHRKISTSHLETCSKVRIPCPNTRCQVSIPRCELSTHRSTCDYEPVSCKYAEVGCEERPPRKDLKKHEEEDQLYGLRAQVVNLVDSTAKSIAINDQSSDCLQQNARATNELIVHTPTDSRNKSIFITAPYRLRLTNFKKYKENSQEFRSLPFYTDRSGYKMCLEVYPNGNGDYEHSYVSVFACLMKGDNDDSLTWPFTGTVTFELLNQLENKNHHKMTARFRDCELIGDRVMNDGIGLGGGITKFISPTDLEYQPDKNCQYLKNDTLVFRISIGTTDNKKKFFEEPGKNFLTFEFNKPPTVDQTLRFSPELPFIKPVEVFQVSSKGGQYRDDSLGLCIDVPKGAVPEGSLLQLEIGMCLYGPFKFPGNLYPIAPILMLCPQSNIKLSRRLRITLPHIISDADEGEIDFFDVQVIKADHTSLFTANETIFDNIIGESNLSLHTSNNCEVATFELSHFCFVTLRATANLQELAQKKGHCICPLLPSPEAMSSGNFMYPLCVTYFIKPCLEAISDQFSKQGYTLQKSLIERFMFKGKRQCIKARLDDKEPCGHGWEVGLKSANRDGFKVIDAASVDFWLKDEDELKLEMEIFIYPPSIQFLVLSQQATASSFMKVQFKLDKEEFFMKLPLQHGLVSSHKSQPLKSQDTDDQESPEYKTMVACTPQLTDALAIDPTSISGNLFAKGIIPHKLHSRLVQSKDGSHDKACQLLDSVTTCVKTRASNFDILLAVLKQQGEWTKAIVSILTDTYFNIRVRKHN